MIFSALLILPLLSGVLSAPAETELSRQGGNPPQLYTPKWNKNEQYRLISFDDKIAFYMKVQDESKGVEVKSEWKDWLKKDVSFVNGNYGKFGNDRVFVLFIVTQPGGILGGMFNYLQPDTEGRNVMIYGMPADWYNKPLDNFGQLKPDFMGRKFGEMVESSSNGIDGRPGKRLWDENIMSYISYTMMQETGISKRALDEKMNNMMKDQSDGPAGRAYFIRDFLHPVYQQAGKAYFKNFFALLAQHYPTRVNENRVKEYAREMTWGEFLHFSSGAAKKDVSEQYKKAFGWDEETAEELEGAKKEFSAVRY